MKAMCLRHFTHPVTGRTGWYCGVDLGDPALDNVDVEADAGVIAALIAEHQPDVIDVRENVEAPDIDAVLALAQDRKRLRSVARHTEPKYTANNITEG
jgi:hypothetical protein